MAVIYPKDSAYTDSGYALSENHLTPGPNRFGARVEHSSAGIVEKLIRGWRSTNPTAARIYDSDSRDRENNS